AAENLRQSRGDLALGLGEIAVARRHRKSVGLAHGRHAEDLDRQIEIARQAADHLELLEILLAETGDIGLDLMEELGDDGGDAFEMTGPRRAIEMVREPGDLDLRREPFRI